MPKLTARCWIMVLALLLATIPAMAGTAMLPWKGASNGDGGIRDLAAEAIIAYAEPDRATYLDNLAVLQLVARRYDDAARSLGELVVLRKAGAQPLDAAGAIRWQVYARARQLETAMHLPFGEAYTRAFRDVFATLDDVMASQVISSFGSDVEPYGPQPAQLRADYLELLAQRKGSDVALADAVALVKAYQAAEAYAAFRPFTGELIDEDDRRRYDVWEPMLVPTPDGASVTVLVMLPRHRAAPLPTLLGFTIYANPWWSSTELRLTAAHGYAAVVGYSRGKGLSPGQAAPYEHDGVDADAAIEWIATQPWSDGRVGMYGGSYNGFTQWAAAKHRPKALRALMPSVTVAPGIDVPMEGNVSLSFVYPWAPYVAEGKGLDEKHYGDDAHWNGLYRRWYESGKSYRALDEVEGKPNPVFQRWLDHPSYDDYWRDMIPQGREFAAIDIPVLTTTGYFDGGQIGALHYVREHQRYNPHAEHYLLIGPWDHVGAQRKARPVVDGYAIDPVAKIDISRVLRYQWFDYVFRGGAKPALLKDRINYEVMGANTWKHAPSVDGMAPGKRRLFLAAENGTARLQDRPSTRASLLAVDLGKRDDLPAADAPSAALDDRHALVFTSEPLPAGTELSGLFSGKLHVVTNKRDFDLRITLYEKKASGEYFQLSWYLARASYMEDRSRRLLLVPGKRTTLAFTNGRTTSRLFEPGSRLVAVVSVVKEPGSSINMGSGGDVGVESVADAGEPLRIEWLGSSYLDLPIGPARVTSGASK
ncbi:CocE/NonD family hydrolase [Luteibacter sp. E-22]|uniref:CocE/NonD family hydrolase n=1 Tax=Luteibacter sp. E-22 TaxID=3404050 RepID=UPI003CE72B5E